MHREILQDLRSAAIPGLMEPRSQDSSRLRTPAGTLLRMLRFRLPLLVSLSLSLTLIGWFAPDARAQAQPVTIGEKTRQWTRLDGFVPMYWDELAGRLYLEISRFDQELLYQTSLPAGLGSNPIGLDRGQLGSTSVVTFQRVGPKVLLTQANYRFRALSQDPAERQAVADSFARSVLWGFKVEAVDDGRVLVDATDFLLRDAHGVGDRLRRANQGAYRVDPNRTTFHLPRTKGFPKNSEVETDRDVRHRRAAGRPREPGGADGRRR